MDRRTTTKKIDEEGVVVGGVGGVGGDASTTHTARDTPATEIR